MRIARLTAALLAAGLLLLGCSGDDSSQADAPAPTSGQAEDTAGGDDIDEDMAEEPAADGGEAGGDGATAGGSDDVVTFGGTGDAVTGRQLARTASLILEVEDVAQAASRVSAAAQRAGGFIADAEVRGGEFGSGRLTLRVPARALDATVEDLAGIGSRVVESSISTEDLTDQLTDIQARIDNLERLEAELQALLTDVRDSDPQATQLLQVFERLNQVRGDIERLEASRAAAQDRVALATINVELLPRSIAPEEMEPEPESTLGQAWETTKDAFGAMGDALIWLGVTILPVLLALFGVPALLVWALVRWRRQRRAAPPSPPHPGDHRDGTPPPPDDGGTSAAQPDGEDADAAPTGATDQREPVR